MIGKTAPTLRLIVGISGASGVAYGVAALRMLQALEIEAHLVMTRSAKITLANELPMKVRDVEMLADIVHSVDDIAAPIASGSFRTMGMLIAPCSIRTLSEIAYGTTSNLLTRAADVVLKERRRLVMLVRETPLHLGHLRAMMLATEAGAIIMPPVPALYAKPELSWTSSSTPRRVPSICLALRQAGRNVGGESGSAAGCAARRGQGLSGCLYGTQRRTSLAFKKISYCRAGLIRTFRQPVGNSAVGAYGVRHDECQRQFQPLNGHGPEDRVALIDKI